MKVAKVIFELKTICTADVNASATLPRQCRWSDKLSGLCKPCLGWWTHSHFL